MNAREILKRTKRVRGRLATRCRVYQGRIGEAGYAATYNNGRTRNGHKVVYEELIGPVPEGLELDHLCRNKACVNPHHLEPVTHLENVRRWARTIVSCRRGHPYTPENTYRSGRGARVCRTCTLVAQRLRYAA